MSIYYVLNAVLPSDLVPARVQIHAKRNDTEKYSFFALYLILYYIDL